MSLFAEYIKERRSQEIVERDWGFATYSFLEDGAYIEDIYIIPAARLLGNASELAHEVEFKAKCLGLKYLYGSVSLNTKDATAGFKTLLAFGFKVTHAIDQMIYFKKEL